MRVVKKKLAELLPADYNPRKISKSALLGLKNSIQKFGYVEPIIWNEKTGCIVGGHQRATALKLAGIEEVDVVVVSLDERDEKALNVTLNNKEIQGDWDEEKLAGILRDIQDLPEFSDLRLDSLIKDLDIDILTGGKDPQKAQVSAQAGDKPQSRCALGEIYALGNHRLLCGDCEDDELVVRVLDGKAPVLMVTDPPYGVEYDPAWRDGVDLGIGKRATGKVQNDSRTNWEVAYRLWGAQVAYVWHACRFAAAFQSSIESAGYQIISQIIWVKQHFAIGRGDYHFQHEPCWYAVRSGGKHNWQGARDQSTVWNISNNNPFGNSAATEEKTGHGTQKPIECMSRPIKNNTAPGDLVVDPFLGSGTTLIAADRLGRACYGAEIDLGYCEMILTRWEKETGKKAVRVWPK